MFIDEFNNEWDERKNIDLDELRFQYTHIPKRIVPKLLEAGLTEEDVDVMLSQVPRNFFEAN